MYPVPSIEIKNLLICDNPLQRHVPKISIDRIDLLEPMGDAQNLRSLPVFFHCTLPEGAVIIATSHSNPVALTVESHQRRQYQVQLVRKQPTLSGDVWFWNSVLVGLEVIHLRYASEQQAVFSTSV